MATFSIALGSADRLVRLYAYPNKPGSTDSLADTILHWFKQTLARDGFATQGANAGIRVESSRYVLEVKGPPDMAKYRDRLPRFLSHGLAALDVIEKLKKVKLRPGQEWPKWLHLPKNNINKLWDPQDTGKWRFFLPVGMAMINQRSLQFFHYPPIRLLNTMRDYLNDPVPVRLIELLEANGVASESEAWLYSTVMDGAPIAAPDDQGTIYKPGDSKTAVHLIPIQRFNDYQRAQTELLLNTSPVNEQYTIPIVVYGTPARETFAKLYMKNRKTVSTTKAENISTVIKGKNTAVLGSGHPYAFYAQVQAQVGSGSVLPEKWPTAVETMIKDLVVCRWQVEMAKDPTTDPDQVLKECESYWNAKEQREAVYTLVLHQGSLLYPDPTSLQFTFGLSLDDARKRVKALLS